MLLSTLQIKSLQAKAETINYNAGELIYDSHNIKQNYIGVLLSGTIKIEYETQNISSELTLKKKGFILSSLPPLPQNNLKFIALSQTKLLLLNQTIIENLPPAIKILFEETPSFLSQQLIQLDPDKIKLQFNFLLDFLEKNALNENLLSLKTYFSSILEFLTKNFAFKQIGFYKYNAKTNQLERIHSWPHKAENFALNLKENINIKQGIFQNNQSLILKSTDSIETCENNDDKHSRQYHSLADQYSHMLIPFTAENKNHYAFLIIHNRPQFQWDIFSSLFKRAGLYLTSLIPKEGFEDEVFEKLTAKRLHIDTLTELKTRFLFKERTHHLLQQRERNKKKVVLFYIAIDRFRQINASLGYDVGDQFLKIIAQRIKSCGRRSDTVARIHGDEFGILALVNHIDESRLIANRVISALEQPMFVDGQECYIGASIGIAIAPKCGQTADELFASAEHAMHLAKEYTGNNYQFAKDVQISRRSDMIKMEAKLRTALDEGEIVNYYQPIVDMHSKKIIGSETLSRWIKKDGAIIPPDQFIPLAEKTGLIVKMSEIMLQKACEANLHCSNSFNQKLKTTVNVSMRWLIDNHFLNSFEKLIQKTNIDPKSIVIELTEGILLRDTKVAKSILNEIQKMGIRIALDDFGTGYSSLSFLEQFEIDYIKIDRSFVSSIQSPNDQAPIVTGLLKLCKELNIEIIAEGIETKIQHDYIKSIGCNYGQGYYYARPLPINDFIEKIKETNKEKQTIFGKHLLRR